MLLKTGPMFSPELKLLIAACRAAYGGGRVRLAAGPAIRWDRLGELAKRHRVEALCWNGLEKLKPKIPMQVTDSLAQATRETVGQAMRMAVEAGRLKQAFDGAGIDLIFVKGAMLGTLAYPKPFLKMSIDIDLLVAPGRLGDACTILRRAGYDPVIPADAKTDRIERWHRESKESVWRHHDVGFQLDLHTRLADQPAIIPTIGMRSPRQLVTVAPGIELPTLGEDELFAYLCVHGASSAWFRLKWVCDLAALLHGKDHRQVDRLYDRSQQLGAGRAAAQALLVADAVFGSCLSDALRERLCANPFNRWLSQIALRQLTAEREPVARPLGTFWIHATQLVMHSRRGQYGIGAGQADPPRGGPRAMTFLGWYQFKLFVEHASGISMDALHILVGFVLFLLAARLLRSGMPRRCPWLALLVLELVNEAYDLTSSAGRISAASWAKAPRTSC